MKIRKQPAVNAVLMSILIIALTYAGGGQNWSFLIPAFFALLVATYWIESIKEKSHERGTGN